MLHSLSVCISVCLYICLSFCLSICQYVYLSVCLLPVCPSVSMSIYLSVFCLSTYLSVSLSGFLLKIIVFWCDFCEEHNWFYGILGMDLVLNVYVLRQYLTIVFICKRNMCLLISGPRFSNASKAARELFKRNISFI